MAPSQESKNLIRGTGIVAGLTFISRIFGFIRDQLVSYLFGATAVADCFLVAYRIPNLLRSFVGEGAMTAAFVPVFASQLKLGKEKAQEVLSQVCGFLLSITTLLTILGIIFSKQIIWLIAPGFSTEDKADLCIFLLRIMMPYIMCISFVAMLNGALNSVNIFGAAAFSQVLMNMVLILGALIAALFDSYNAVLILSFSVVAGGIVQVLVQIPALHKAGLKLRINLRFLSPPVKELIRLMTPALFGATIYQISQFVNTLFASLLNSGSVSWLYYSDRLTQLPIGIFSVALASVLLPALSKARDDSDTQSFHKSLINSLRYTSFFILPIAGCIFYYADPLIALMFERGKFTAWDTIQTARAVRANAIGLWAVGCHSLVVRAFIARKDTRTPTLVGLGSLLVSILLAVSFMGAVSDSTHPQLANILLSVQTILSYVIPQLSLQHAGLALASSVAATLAFPFILYIFTRSERDIRWSQFIQSTWRAILALDVAIAAAFLLDDFAPLGKFVVLFQAAIFLTIYFIAGLCLRAAEARESGAILKKYITKRS